MNKVVISFNLLKQKRLTSDQMYVALSRITSLEGLFLTGVFNETAITADVTSTNEYNYLRENQTIQTQSLSNDYLYSIVLSNVRSIRKHVVDIRADLRFIYSNLILCTETQLVTNESSDHIHIDGF